MHALGVFSCREHCSCSRQLTASSASQVLLVAFCAQLACLSTCLLLAPACHRSRSSCFTTSSSMSKTSLMAMILTLRWRSLRYVLWHAAATDKTGITGCPFIQCVACCLAYFHSPVQPTVAMQAFIFMNTGHHHRPPPAPLCVVGADVPRGQLVGGAAAVGAAE